MKTIYTQAITINGQRYTLDDLHKAAGCALRHRERRTGARLNLSYTTVGDLVSSAWVLMVERGLSLTRAADEAARQALMVCFISLRVFLDIRSTSFGLFVLLFACNTQAMPE